MEVNSPSSGYPTWNTRPAAAPAGLYALSACLKTTYSPGERACISWILAAAVCKSRMVSTHSKFTAFVFFEMSKGIPLGDAPGG